MWVLLLPVCNSVSPLPYRTKGGRSQEAEDEGRGEAEERGRGTEAEEAVLGRGGARLALSGRFGLFKNVFSSTCLGLRNSSVKGNGSYILVDET